MDIQKFMDENYEDFRELKFVKSMKEEAYKEIIEEIFKQLYFYEENITSLKVKEVNKILEEIRDKFLYKNYKRQGLNISIKEVEKLLEDLKKEQKEVKEKLNINLEKEKKFIVSIVNHPSVVDDRTFYASDTWEIENDKE